MHSLRADFITQTEYFCEREYIGHTVHLVNRSAMYMRWTFRSMPQDVNLQVACDKRFSSIVTTGNP